MSAPRFEVRSYAMRDGGLISGIVTVGLLKVMAVVTGFAVNVVLSRLLPLDQLGAYFLLTSIVQMGAIAAIFGLNQSAAPLIAGTLATDRPGRIRRIMRVIGWTILFGLSLICLIVALMFDRFIDIFGMPEMGIGVLAVVLIWLLARTLVIGGAHVLRAFGRMGQFGLMESLLFNLLFLLAVTFLFVSGAQPELQTILRWAAVSGVVCLPIIAVLISRAFVDLPSVDRGTDPELSHVLRIGFPLWIIVLANTGLVEAHLWIAGAIGGDEAAGLFGAAKRTVSLLAFPVLALNLALGPRVSHLWHAERLDDLRGLLGVAATAIAAVALVILAGMLLIGPAILSVLFGSQFVAAWPALLALLVGQTINGLTGLPMLLLSVSSEQRAAMVISIFAGLAGVFVSLWLGNMDPVLGVAVGSCVAVTLQNLFAVLVCRMRLNINTLPTWRAADLRAALNAGRLK